jgi:hypothetical protein
MDINRPYNVISHSATHIHKNPVRPLDGNPILVPPSLTSVADDRQQIHALVTPFASLT